MAFNGWAGRRHITTIYDMCPSKTGWKGASIALWNIVKSTELLKNNTRKRRKRFSYQRE